MTKRKAKNPEKTRQTTSLSQKLTNKQNLERSFFATIFETILAHKPRCKKTNTLTSYSYLYHTTHTLKHTHISQPYPPHSILITKLQQTHICTKHKHKQTNK